VISIFIDVPNGMRELRKFVSGDRNKLDGIRWTEVLQGRGIRKRRRGK
jgi:hypothetical protein